MSPTQPREAPIKAETLGGGGRILLLVDCFFTALTSKNHRELEIAWEQVQEGLLQEAGPWVLGFAN